MIRQPRRIDLVQGDTGPATQVSLTDPDQADAPIDLSAAGTAVRLVVKTAPRGGETSTIVATITCSKLTGYVQADESITTEAPFNVPGRGGMVQIDAWPTVLTNVVGSYIGWIEIAFESGLLLTLKRPVPVVVLPK